MLDCLSALSQWLAPLWEMSVTAAYAAAVVIVLRLLLKKRAPKQVLCLLWLVVFARLLLPMSLESPLSIVPDAQQVQFTQNLPSQPAGGGQTSPAQGNPPAQNHEPAQGQPSGQNPDAVTPVAGNPGVPTLTAPEGMAPAAPPQEDQAGFPWRAVLAGVWLAGMTAMALYALVSYFRLRRRLFDAIRAKDGAWEHPAVNSPFILGVLRPRIYLPAGLAGQPRQFILCHERAHLRRLDHILKPICWAALAIHWFNPMVWAAYILMGRDIEAACDEAVIRKLGPHVKADYSATLLALATNGRVPAPCPLAFDEGDAKGRIKNVLRYRRPALWIVVVSVIAAVLAAVCLLTDPVAAKGPDDDPSPSAEPSQEPVNLADTLLDPWMREVLDGERTFRDFYQERNSDDNPDYTIHQLRSFYYGDDQNLDTVVELGKLTVIDLDYDGINEMVVYPTGDYEYLYSVVGYLVLHRQGDTVYGYNPSWRTMGDLKVDGTFDWSGSAFNWGTGSLRFTEEGFEVHDITWCDIYIDDEHYFVDGQTATREEFDTAANAHFIKPDVIWYTYADGVLARVPPSIPLDEYALSAPCPEDFLNITPEDGDQYLLYRQAYALCNRLFGTTNDNADFFPGQGILEPAEQVERNGLTYAPASGRFARWDDFERAVLSVFTQEFWDAKNVFDDNGSPIYIDVDGRLYYLTYGRSGGNYNGFFPETFRLVEKTDDTVSFIMTAYYSNSYPLEGETYADVDARMAAYWEYSIDFPMRMVKTADGWRFDEFHLAQTDGGEPFYSRRVLNPNAPGSDTLSIPADMELLDASNYYSASYDVRLWLDGKETLWLEWNNTTFRLDTSISRAQFSRLYYRDFDDDYQREVVIAYYFNGFPQLDLYEWVDNRPVLTSSYNTEQLLLRFNRNNVAAYSKNSRNLTVTYTHVEGDDASDDYYRRHITGSCVLPSGFFDGGYEHIRDGYTYAYANQFQRFYLDSTANTFWFDFDFYLADETMKDLTYVDKPPYTDYAGHYMVGTAVGRTAFTLSYDGTQWRAQETDVIHLDYHDEMVQPYIADITAAAPLSAPLVSTSNDLPTDPNQWYKVAELPDNMIWLYARNYGQETLLRWDGNFYKLFNHVAHTPHCNMPQLKKLGDADHYGPLAAISHVNSGTGVSAYELVVYDLDSTVPVDYTHDWTALAEDFNKNHTFRFDNDTRVMTLTYQGQTVTKTLTYELVGDHDRIEREGCSLSITGEQIHYSFDETSNGSFQLRLGAKFLIDYNWAPSLFPAEVTWTLRFNGSGFDVVPGSCVVT